MECNQFDEAYFVEIKQCLKNKKVERVLNILFSNEPNEIYYF